MPGQGDDYFYGFGYGRSATDPDLLVEKTRFHLKMPELTRSANGTIFVDGRVRGRISGVVDATIRGVIHGEVSAIVEAGALSEDPEREEGKSDETQMPDA